jgi:hypothetical protein
MEYGIKKGLYIVLHTYTLTHILYWIYDMNYLIYSLLNL